MRFSPDMRLFEENPHNPSVFSLMRAAGLEEVKILDFCVPHNPYFPTPRLHEKIAARLHETLLYYPSHNEVIAEAVAEMMGLKPETVVVANGSDEIITWVGQLFVQKGMATAVPTFGRWVDSPRAAGKRVSVMELPESEGFRLDPRRFIEFVGQEGADVAVIVNPNNPSGAFINKAEVCELVGALSDLELVVVDESFIDFAAIEGIPTMASEVTRFPNMLVLKSMGKIFGLNGLRLGYGITRPEVAERLRLTMPRWNVNSLAELLLFDLRDHFEEYEISRVQCIRDRMELQATLERIMGLKVYPSYANFVLVQILGDYNATQIRNRLLFDYGFFVRDCDNKEGIGNRFLRISCRCPQENQELVSALREILTTPTPCHPTAKSSVDIRSAEMSAPEPPIGL